MATSDTPNCSIARALSEIGERWSLLIIREAIMGAMRFDEFHERLGVARNILNSRLATLIEHGVMTRTASPDSARIHYYRLTSKGLDLYPVLAALMHWGDHWIHADTGPPIVLRDRKSGKPVRKMSIVAADGRTLRPADIAVTAGEGATADTRRRLQSAR